MTKIRRNGPCPCGSGSKAKRCCDGNDEAMGFHCLPADLCLSVAPDLVDIEKEEFRALFDELPFLPEIYRSLYVNLGMITPDMDRAIDALDDNDMDGFREVLKRVTAEVDTPGRRLKLAEAILTLRDEECIPADLAAAAVLDLGMKGGSNLLLSSVANSLLVLADATGILMPA